MSANPQSSVPRVELNGLDFVVHYGVSIVLLALSAVALYGLLTNHVIPSRIQAAYIMLVAPLPVAAIVAWQKMRELRFRRFTTSSDSSTNYSKVLDAMRKAEWRVRSHSAHSRIVAAVPGKITWGTRVEMHFDGTDVLVNSICDPWRGGGLGFGENSKNMRYIGKAVADI